MENASERQRTQTHEEVKYWQEKTHKLRKQIQKYKRKRKERHRSRNEKTYKLEKRKYKRKQKQIEGKVRKEKPNIRGS